MKPVSIITEARSTKKNKAAAHHEQPPLLSNNLITKKLKPIILVTIENVLSFSIFIYCQKYHTYYEEKHEYRRNLT